jgi:uracil-DNA glycosylase
VDLVSLDDVRREALRCARCTSRSRPSHIPLVEGRTQVVFGVGPSHADLMFIGEAPSKDEDEIGEPFIGKGPQQAGSILDERLTQVGIRRTDVYITNVVLCRPTEIKNGGPPSNRPPSESKGDCMRVVARRASKRTRSS